MDPTQLRFWIKTLVDSGADIKVASKAIGKMEGGVAKYGDFDPEKDTRVFSKEILDELYDGINYSVMAMLKAQQYNEPTDEVIKILKDLIKLCKYIEVNLR